MSVHVFFAFSAGLAKEITVPAGTLRACQEHVAKVERALGFEVDQYLDNPPYWISTTPAAGVTDETLCKVASQHNRWVRWLHGRLGAWSKATMKKPIRDGWHERPGFDATDDSMIFVAGNYGKPVETEKLTPEGAATFWHGLTEIDVPPARWTRDYYVERMQHVYEVLRGVDSEGVAFDAKPLSSKQAAAVVRVIDRYLDKHDTRLDVPRGRDHLAASDDGGYDWCDTHGAVHWDDGMCCSKRTCELRREMRKEGRR